MLPTRQTIIAIIADEARIEADKLEPEATLDSLGIASLDVMSVLFVIEEKFDVIIQQEDIAATDTLGQFVDVIFAKVAAI